MFCSHLEERKAVMNELRKIVETTFQQVIREIMIFHSKIRRLRRDARRILRTTADESFSELSE